MRYRWLWVVVLVALGLAAAAWIWMARPASVTPLPTELAPDQELREERAREREAWIESLHRAPEGTDWRAIENANWRAHLASARAKSTAMDAAGVVTRWREVGSTNLAGRTHHVAYDPVTHDLWLGSNLGGVWYGQLDPWDPSAEVQWEPRGDAIYGYSMQVLRLPGASEVILKTHGAAWSGEIHRTADGGATWTVAAGVDARPRRLVAVGETVFALADTPNHWMDNGSSTLLRSNDRGQSFVALRQTQSFRGDLWVANQGAGPLYFVSDEGLEVSDDLGASWSVVGELPVGGDRVVLTGSSAAGTPCLYAAIDQGGGTWALAASEDGGATWEVRHQVEDFWGDLTSLAASTRDPDLVLYAGVDAYRSVDGGRTFVRINGWAEYYQNPVSKLHADITAFDFVPLPGGDELLFISTDGGLYISRNGGATVQNLSLDNLRISQYYATLTDRLDPARIQAGSQDQGYQVGTVNGGFEQIISGDYGQLTSSSGRHDLVYSVYPGFVLVAEQRASGGVRLHWSTEFPAGETHHWLPFILADPDDPEAFYFCGRRIHRYERTSTSTWTPTQMPHLFAADQSDYVSALAIAPSNSDRWYAATYRGAIWTSADRGQTWTEATFANAPAPQYLTGMALAVDPDDAQTVYVGGSGYAEKAVYRSTDAGGTFAPFATGLPRTLVHDLAVHAPTGDLFAATESGPYRWTAASGRWTSLLDGEAPMTTYWSVEALARSVRFGTYGRGIWDWAPQTPRAASGRAGR